MIEEQELMIEEQTTKYTNAFNECKSYEKHFLHSFFKRYK